jgi:hypothetical protein
MTEWKMPSDYEMEIALAVERLAEVFAKHGGRLREVVVVNRVQPTITVQAFDGPVTVFFGDEQSPWIRAMHAKDVFAQAMKDADRRVAELTPSSEDA